MDNRIEVKTADLIGPALDWAVGEAIGEKNQISSGFIDNEKGQAVLISWCWNAYSTDWSLAGPLIDANSFEVTKECGGWAAIRERYCGEPIRWWPEGETIQIAVCRAIVAAKFGDDVMVPKELVQ